MAQSFADWQLADVFVTAKGAKQCALADGSKSPILYSPEDPLTAPFGFSSWEESSRKNLELRCTKGVEDYFTQFDEWVRAYLVQNSERLFKKKLIAEQVAECYKSPLHKKGDYPALLRTKVNTSGKNAVRIWDEQGNEVDEPKRLAGHSGEAYAPHSLSLDNGPIIRLHRRMYRSAVAHTAPHLPVRRAKSLIDRQ